MGMAIIKNNKYQELVRMWGKKNSPSLLWEGKLVQPLWKTEILQKIKNRTTM